MTYLSIESRYICYVLPVVKFAIAGSCDRLNPTGYNCLLLIYYPSECDLKVASRFEQIGSAENVSGENHMYRKSMRKYIIKSLVKLNCATSDC